MKAWLPKLKEKLEEIAKSKGWKLANVRKLLTDELKVGKFGDLSAIYTSVKNSLTAHHIPSDAFIKKYNENFYKENIEYKTTILNSPDNAPNLSTWLKQLATITTNETTFWTGSLDYFYKIEKGILKIKAVNNFSIDSGVTRNKKDNLVRIPGYRCPLGSTFQSFLFDMDIKTILKHEK